MDGMRDSTCNFSLLTTSRLSRSPLENGTLASFSDSGSVCSAYRHTAMAPQKKKKVASHSDFTKIKSSIKAKQRAAPSNATNTSFKARSIVLPNQSTITQIEERKQQKLTDSKGRGVHELVTVIRGVGRRESKSDAIESLNGLLSKVPDPVTTALGLLSVVLPSITASAACIRSALTKLMSTILQIVPTTALVPYANTVTLWITSGMNHIWKEVREDAAKLAEMVIDALGPQLVRGWSITASSTKPASPGVDAETMSQGQRIFDTLLTSLGIAYAVPSLHAASSSKASAASTMSIHSDLSSCPLIKLRLLRCLDKLIRHQAGLVETISHDGDAQDEFPIWIFRSCFESLADWEAFLGSDGQISTHTGESQATEIQITSREIAPFTTSSALLEHGRDANLVDLRSSTKGGLEDVQSLSRVISTAAFLTTAKDQNASSSDYSAQNPYLAFYSAIHLLLLHTFLDHAPSCLGPDAPVSTTKPSLGLQLVDSVMSLTKTIGRATLRQSDELTALKQADKEALAKMSTLANHAALYFPYESRLRGQESYNFSVVLKRLSSAWCEIVGMIRMLSRGELIVEQRVKGGKLAKEAVIEHSITVQQYLSQVFSQDISTTSSQVAVASGGLSTVAHRLADSEYLSLLPTMWLLISEDITAAVNAHQLLGAIIEHWSRSKVTTPIKFHGLRFLLRICTLPHYKSLRSQLRKRLTRPSSEVHKVLRQKFIQNNLGKALYEIGAASVASAATAVSSIEMTTQCLSIILDLLRFDAGLMEGLADRVILYSTLKPFFWITTKGREVPGPLKRLQNSRKGRSAWSIASALRAYILVDDQGLNWDGEIGRAEGLSSPARELIEAMNKAGVP